MIAIEPVPANVGRIRQNIEANSLTEVVEIIHTAVREREGIVHLQGALGYELTNEAGKHLPADHEAAGVESIWARMRQ